MLHSIPIYAVMVENLGERGAYYTALRLLQHEVNSRSTVNTAVAITPDNVNTTSSIIVSNVYPSSIMTVSTAITACLAGGIYYLYVRGKK